MGVVDGELLFERFFSLRGFLGWESSLSESGSLLAASGDFSSLVFSAESVLACLGGHLL
jgi:hypothetical protein